ncbi:MAG TPA: 5'-nucleotidase C-terminal domain-containing protein [Pyrinomonadaceae bacterium]|nr:5'-nucleotidase C-terminal domain-containing protein [Pyrinomonadaceae bacterium]
MKNHLLDWRKTTAAALLLAAIIFSVAAQQRPECKIKVTLLQVNDVYQFVPVDQGRNGGLARVLTLKKSIQKENPNTLFLLAGDTISPSVESITHQGAQMIEAWNAAELDYATFGNHEFDFGPSVLRDRIKESRFKWIAANVIDTTTGKPFAGVDPYVIREFGGVKVGIFGLVLPETKATSRPGDNVEFRSPCETAKQMVSEIHERGAKVVVALTHLSLREDKEVARCADVDVIIGGHEHSLLESSAGGAPIFKMTADARELGQIDLNISSDGTLESIDWKVIRVTDETKNDPQFASVQRKYARLLAQLQKPLGRTSVALDARTQENRTSETNVGDLITDSFRKATASDVALMNGGSVRADSVIPIGTITVRDVLSMLPFKNKLIKIEVTGAMILAALEHGVSRTAPRAQPGRFPQVSGMTFSFDASKPPGSRVTNVMIGRRPLDPNRKYTLTTTTFIALDGGDGYTMFKDARVVLPPDRAPLDSDVLATEISRSRTIAPKVDGRIKRLDTAAQDTATCN